ncbi:MAG: cation:dicarboxylase symporter family transporter, partial [Nitrospira sp.]|nr:cation:dicarboxylase symporter family transporter [Nitrospira sp.]
MHPLTIDTTSMEPSKISNTTTRLPLYILVGLLAGVVSGFVLHTNYLTDDNTALQTIENGVHEITGQLSRESDSNARLLLEQQQKDLSQQRSAVLTARDKKVEPFSLLADMFLRLIKMIVAPLVFTTLVVGVAKLGDINSVGRIGGKTLAWFFSASLMSLLLGMIIVNVLKPGEAMNLPLPDLHERLDIERGDFSLKNFLYHVFPSSVIDAMAKNEILQ